jgi:hypothetical protein
MIADEKLVMKAGWHATIESPTSTKEIRTGMMKGREALTRRRGYRFYYERKILELGRKRALFKTALYFILTYTGGGAFKRWWRERFELLLRREGTQHLP